MIDALDIAMSDSVLPSYAHLRARTDGQPPGTAWGVFGTDDEVGTLNLVTRERMLAARELVVTGEVHSLNWRVDLPSPSPWRPTPVRTQVGQAGVGRDDYLTPFYLQYSSQWDGLRHIESPDGFYNGVSAAQVDDPSSATLGIDVWARRGIAGCGVLLDVARRCEQLGEPIDPTRDFAITPDLLDDTARHQGVEIQTGDILLVRTGWAGWYASLAPESREAAYQPESAQPGLASTEATAAWLWDRHVAAIASDNSALETSPLDMRPGQFLHIRLIAGFGMPIGEHFWLDDLAVACAADSRWRFLFTSAPLHVVGGVGSPPNALAIR